MAREAAESAGVACRLTGSQAVLEAFPALFVAVRGGGRGVGVDQESGVLLPERASSFGVRAGWCLTPPGGNLAFLR